MANVDHLTVRIHVDVKTLRDEFAMAALQICLKDLDKSYDDWANEAYAIADAMMEARKS